MNNQNLSRFKNALIRQMQMQDLNPIIARTSAGVKTIPLDEFDFDDRTFRVRQDTSAACDADALIVERGTVDFSGSHPVIVYRDGRLIHGHRRLEAVRDSEIVKRVRCVVIDGSTDVADLLAARANLANGQLLSPSDRRECFRKEQTIHAKLRSPKRSDRYWARIYHCSPTTIGNWLAELTAGDTLNARRPGVQIGHQPGPAAPKHKPTAVANRGIAADGPTTVSPKRTDETDELVENLEAAALAIVHDVDGTELTDAHRRRIADVVEKLRPVCRGVANSEAAA